MNFLHCLFRLNQLNSSLLSYLKIYVCSRSNHRLHTLFIFTNVLNKKQLYSEINLQWNTKMKQKTLNVKERKFNMLIKYIQYVIPFFFFSFKSINKIWKWVETEYQIYVWQATKCCYLRYRIPHSGTNTLNNNTTFISQMLT